jgi:hypothetical protein
MIPVAQETLDFGEKKCTTVSVAGPVTGRECHRHRMAREHAPLLTQGRSATLPNPTIATCGG